MGESSIAQLLKEIKTDNKEIKNDNKEIKESISQMNTKIKSIEIKQITDDQKTSNEFLQIRNEMKSNNEDIEKKISDLKTMKEMNEKNLTEKVVETLKPKIRDIEVKSKADLRNIIREELALQLEADVDGETTDIAADEGTMKEP